MITGLLVKIQNKLEYAHCQGVHFSRKTSLGRVAQTSTVLGVVLGVHLCLVVLGITAPVEWGAWFSSRMCLQWSAYLVCLSGFHLLEFFATALNGDDELSDISFVVSHSLAYTAAALASWTEFWVEYALQRAGYLPFDKSQFALVGLFMVLAGNAVRFHGMTWCGKNFSHLVMTERRSDHKLVTTGIYSILRHPAYFGWFYWSVGTQILLGNPLCVVAYTIVSWRFFKNRIPFEESNLERFYGEEYRSYKARTVVGIPLIK